MSAAEHKFWMDEGEMSRATKPRVVFAFKNTRRVMTDEVLKRVRTYEWNKEVIPGVKAIGTSGHTPGHTSHVVASGNKAVYVQADVTYAPFLFARHPEWHFMLDVDPVAAEAARRKVYDMLVADRMLVLVPLPVSRCRVSKRAEPVIAKFSCTGRQRSDDHWRIAPHKRGRCTPIAKEPRDCVSPMDPTPNVRAQSGDRRESRPSARRVAPRRRCTLADDDQQGTVAS